MNHALLVAGQVVRQVSRPGDMRLQQGLPDPGDVPVPENAETAGDQPLLDAVPLAVLVGQKRTSAWATVNRTVLTATISSC